MGSELTARGHASPVPGQASAAITLGDYRALAAFRRSLRDFLYFSDSAARAEGMTAAQHQLLLAIKGAEGDQPPTIGDLASAFKLRHHSAVELVDRAVAAGLVERHQDSHDGRYQRVVLTEAGEAKLAALTALHLEELRRFRDETIAPLATIRGAPGS